MWGEGGHVGTEGALINISEPVVSHLGAQTNRWAQLVRVTVVQASGQ